MAIEAVPQTNYSQTLILGCLDLRPRPKTVLHECHYVPRAGARPIYILTRKTPTG